MNKPVSPPAGASLCEACQGACMVRDLEYARYLAELEAALEARGITLAELCEREGWDEATLRGWMRTCLACHGFGWRLDPGTTPLRAYCDDTVQAFGNAKAPPPPRWVVALYVIAGKLWPRLNPQERKKLEYQFFDGRWAA